MKWCKAIVILLQFSNVIASLSGSISSVTTYAREDKNITSASVICGKNSRETHYYKESIVKIRDCNGRSEIIGVVEGHLNDTLTYKQQRNILSYVARIQSDIRRHFNSILAKRTIQ